MSDKQDLFAALDAAAAELAKQFDENVVLGFFPASDTGIANSYSARLDCPGVPCGIYACSPNGWSAALVKALADRSDKMRELEREAAIRAEIEVRMNQRKAA